MTPRRCNIETKGLRGNRQSVVRYVRWSRSCRILGISQPLLLLLLLHLLLLRHPFFVVTPAAAAVAQGIAASIISHVIHPARPCVSVPGRRKPADIKGAPALKSDSPASSTLIQESRMPLDAGRLEAGASASACCWRYATSKLTFARSVSPMALLTCNRS